ncbi:hypothetical protein AVEN_109116-1 [Araneus ventricosus]|uniref:Histone-lysine N-methyltransferase SETMAR n=1 Tax=Araneus ventricosus TaxID=182803 RepID=A0A4Y2VT11_ARAVE|nr:hypothetical protein AVEN_242930-1 [Araneus ventricosus]GBO26998.1 hypothetical protein AVEN_109116-1 [Araneus ventricosus]
MSDCVVRGWRIKFKDWRTDFHEEEGQGRKSVATEYLASSRQLLEQFKWDVSDHPAYSPDLATSDFYLFIENKNWLGGQSFQKQQELQSNV